VVRNFGVDTVEPGRLKEEQHSRAELNRVQAGGSVSTSGLLAVPRYQRGVGLFQLDAEGSATLVATVTEGITEATSVAWVRPDVLAVADSVYNVKFLRVGPDHRTAKVGEWRPPDAGSAYFCSLACRNGRLAVGVADGRVFVADIRVAPF
jgi:hypothetical protein